MHRREFANLEAIAIWQRYAKELPNDPAEYPRWLAITLGNLSNHFGSTAESRLRHPRRALELAKQAVDLAPREAPIWRNLGVAHYRNGELAAAVLALEKAIEFGHGDSRGARYFLALTYWKLDRKEDARKALARAHVDTEKDAAGNAANWLLAEDIRRARAEATAIIGP